jgi:hypothetical protein
MPHRPVTFTVVVDAVALLAASVALALAPALARAAPQGGALRHDAAARPPVKRARVVAAHVAAEPAPPRREPTPGERRTAVHDARMAALRARLDALADAHAGDDVEERVVVFDATGELLPVHRETLATYVDVMRAGGATVIAEACAPLDDADGARLHRAVARAFESVGAAAWAVRAQPGPCSLRGGVVLRPAR